MFWLCSSGPSRHDTRRIQIITLDGTSYAAKANHLRHGTFLACIHFQQHPGLALPRVCTKPAHRFPTPFTLLNEEFGIIAEVAYAILRVVMVFRSTV